MTQKTLRERASKVETPPSRERHSPFEPFPGYPEYCETCGALWDAHPLSIRLAVQELPLWS